MNVSQTVELYAKVSQAGVIARTMGALSHRPVQLIDVQRAFWELTRRNMQGELSPRAQEVLCRIWYLSYENQRPLTTLELCEAHGMLYTVVYADAGETGLFEVKAVPGITVFGDPHHDFSNAQKGSTFSGRTMCHMLNDAFNMALVVKKFEEIAH